MIPWRTQINELSQILFLVNNGILTVVGGTSTCNENDHFASVNTQFKFLSSWVVVRTKNTALTKLLQAVTRDRRSFAVVFSLIELSFG